MFDNDADAERYLNSTICFHKGEPFLAGRVRGGVVSGTTLPIEGPKARGVQVSYLDEDFNCKTYTLGYMNTRDNRASYVTRLPVRGMAQGLSRGNVNFSNNEGGRLGFQNAVYEQGFHDMLVGNYPSFKEAIEILTTNRNSRSVAFCREFALRRNPDLPDLFVLDYKGRQVAWGNGAAFSVPTKHLYLIEKMRDNGVKVAA